MAHKFDRIFLFSLPLLVILCRLPLLENPLDDDSAANAYGARLILQGEPLYSTYHPGHHLPAIHYTYALAFLLLGDSSFAIKLFLALWLIPTTYLLYYLSRTFADKKTSGLAVIFFLLLTANHALEGHTAEIELFANLPRLGATLLLITLLHQNAKPWRFALIGLIAAVCILFKAVYISPLVLTILMLWDKFWPHRRETRAVIPLVQSLTWLAAGFIGGLLPVLVYFGVLGLLPRIGLVFTLGQDHISSNSVNPIFIFLYPLSGLAIANLPLLVLGLTGVLLMPLDKSIPSLPKRIIPLWLLISFVEAGFSRHAFLHYYILITPSLSLLAAWSITQIYRFSQLHARFRSIAWLLPAMLILAVGGIYFFVNGGHLYHYFRYKTNQETYRDFVLNSWPPTGSMFIALQDIAAYVQTHSQPRERIYIWGEEFQLYYLANRRCALDFIWSPYLDSPAIPGGPTEMQRQVLAATTEFIIVAQDNPPAWLTNGLAEHYRLVKTISNRKIYQRLDSPEQVVQN
jgi:hypothetical protein